MTKKTPLNALKFAALSLLAATSLSWAQGGKPGEKAAAPKAAAAAAAKPAAASGEPIVLGQSVPLSGPAKDLGIEMREGALAYFDQVNKKGGVNGRPIELKTLDDGYEPDRAEANTKAFVKDNVFSLFGYVGTPTSNKAKPIFEAASIPFVGAFTGAESLRTPVSPMIFNFRSGYNEETERIVELLTGFGIKNIAVFYQNDAYGQAGLNGVKLALDKRKLPMGATGTVERNKAAEEDVKAAVETIGKGNPDAIVMISAYASVAQFVKSYRKSSAKPPQFFTVSFVGSISLAKALGNDGNGVVISQVVPPFNDPSFPVVSEYIAAMKERNPKPTLSFTSLEGFIAAKMMVAGMTKAGTPLTREAFLNAMNSFKKLDLGGVFISFSPEDHRGSGFVDLTMITKDGSFIY